MANYRTTVLGYATDDKGNNIGALVLTAALNQEEYKKKSPLAEFYMVPIYDPKQPNAPDYLIKGNKDGIYAYTALDPTIFESYQDKQLVTASLVVPTIQTVNNKFRNFKDEQTITTNVSDISTSSTTGTAIGRIIDYKDPKTNEDKLIPALVTQYPYADPHGESAIIVAQEMATIEKIESEKKEGNEEYESGIIKYIPNEPLVKCLLGSTIYSEGQMVIPQMQTIKQGWSNDEIQAIWHISPQGTSEYGGNDPKPFISAAADFTIHPLTPVPKIEKGKIVGYEKLKDSNLTWNTNFRVNTNTIISLPQGAGPDDEKAAFRIKALSSYNIGRFCEGQANTTNAADDIFVIQPSVDKNGFFDTISNCLSWFNKGVKVINTVAETAPAVLETIKQTFALDHENADTEDRAGIGLNGDLRIDAPVVTVEDPEHPEKTITKTLWPHISGRIGQQILEIPEIKAENGIFDWLGGVIKAIIPMVDANGKLTYGEGPEILSTKYYPQTKEWKHVCNANVFFNKDFVSKATVVPNAEGIPVVTSIGKCDLDYENYEINLRSKGSAHSPPPEDWHPHIKIDCINPQNDDKTLFLSLTPFQKDGLDRGDLVISAAVQASVYGNWCFDKLPIFTGGEYPEDYPGEAFITKRYADSNYGGNAFLKLSSEDNQTLTGNGELIYNTDKRVYFFGPVLFNPIQPTGTGSTEIMFNRHPVYSATGEDIKDPIDVNYITKAYADSTYYNKSTGITGYAKLHSTTAQLFAGAGAIYFGDRYSEGQDIDSKIVYFNDHPTYVGPDTAAFADKSYITRGFADSKYLRLDNPGAAFQRLTSPTGSGIEFGAPQEKAYPVNFNDIPYYTGLAKTIDQVGGNGFLTKDLVTAYAAPSELRYQIGDYDRKIGNMKPDFIQGEIDGYEYEELQFPMYLSSNWHDPYILGFRVTFKPNAQGEIRFYPSLLCSYTNAQGQSTVATIWNGDTNTK